MQGFRFAQKDSVCYLESTALAGCDFLVHAFCTRHQGVSEDGFASLNFSTRTGDEPGKVCANWELLGAAFGIALDGFLTVHQVHGDVIQVVDGSVQIPRAADFPPEAELSCDAMITRQPGIALGIKTADCVPIFLVDRIQGAIGAVHAGWQGTVRGIAGKAVEALARHFASRPEDIIAAIGPAIGPCCYEVDDRVYQAMPAAGGGRSFFHPSRRAGRWMLDLAAVNRWQLEEKGVPRANIAAARLCTSCLSGTFFSHRRDGEKTGRHFNFLMLKRD